MEADSALLKEVFGATLAVCDECRIIPTDTGFAVYAMSKDHVSVFRADAATGGSPSETEVTVDAGGVCSMLRFAEKGVADLTVKGGTVSLSSAGLVQTRGALTDDDSPVRYPPIKFTHSFSPDPRALSRFLKSAGDIEFCRIAVDGGRVVYTCSDEKRDGSTAEVPSADAKGDGPLAGTFNLGLLRDIHDRIPKDGVCTVSMVEYGPIEIKYTTDVYVLRWIVAPRIEDERP